MCVKQLAPNVLNERTFDAREQFSEVFALLTQARELSTNTDTHSAANERNELANTIQSLIETNLEELEALPRHEHYSRHVIGTDDDWMGFICRWENQSESAIHGHPSFAYYQVLRGQFTMDFYAPSNDEQATWLETRQMTRTDAVWQQGKLGQYDNMIHKVKSDQQDGFTLHLFSENPCLGKHFSAGC